MYWSSNKYTRLIAITIIVYFMYNYYLRHK